MEAYTRKIQTLRAGEKDINVVRASSPQARASSVTPANRSQSVDRKKSATEDEKIARIKDLQTVSKVVDAVKSSVSALQTQLAEHRTEVKKEVDELNKQVLAVKQEADQAKTERLKQKLDSFINSYNQNEVAHSDSFKEVEKALREVAERLDQFESLL
jgi:hypothetical protein